MSLFYDKNKDYEKSKILIENYVAEVLFLISSLIDKGASATEKCCLYISDND